MDVYRKVLVKLYKETNGNTSETVNLLDLIKKAGFLPSYKEIVKELAYRSWIYEEKHDKVKLTHWGVDEAKKWLSGNSSSDQDLKKNVNRLSAETSEFTVEVEKFAADISLEKLGAIEKKFNKINKLIEEIKSDL